MLEALAEHGLRPGADTPVALLREQINDLYRFEIRRLRDRCRAGEFTTQSCRARVVELRKRYLLLSIPVERWLVETSARYWRAGLKSRLLRKSRLQDPAPTSYVCPGNRAPPPKLIRVGIGPPSVTLTAQYLNSGIFPNGSSTGLVSMLAAAS